MGKVRKAKKVSNKRPEPVEEVQEQEPLEKKGMKRAAESDGPESSKKLRKEKKSKPIEEEEPMEEMDDEEETSEAGDVDDEEIDDEDLGDEEEDEDSDDEDEEEDETRTKEMMEDEATEFMNTDVEAFPIQDDDKEGIINILTQIFLRNGDVDVPAITEAIIAQKPSIGSVIGPAEDETDEENTNMVYAMTSVLGVDTATQDEKASKYARALVNFVNERADKYALKETAKRFSEILATKVGFLVNERMLHFPTNIIAPSFESLKGELLGLPKPYKNVLYFQKIRVADKEKEESAPGPSKSEGGKKKKKGKAEKKRIAAAALASAEVVYDNVEDAELFKLTAGAVHYFDYPVHNDIEAGSRFHIVEKEGKKFRPFRRAVIMDAKRFDAFVNAMTSFAG